MRPLNATPQRDPSTRPLAIQAAGVRAHKSLRAFISLLLLLIAASTKSS